jgi:hypothetical protein
MEVVVTDVRTEPAEPEPSLAEIIETGIRRGVTAIVVGAGIIGLAIYARPAPPRYDAFAIGSQIVRVDMRTGTIISCEGAQTCQLVLKRGQHLQRVRRTDALPKPAAATPLPAAPAAEK